MKIKKYDNKTTEVANICDFSQNLDYNIQTAKERIDYVNKMMYTDTGYPVEFFEKLFDQDERIEMSKRKLKDGEIVQKYVNLFPNSNDDKYEDTYEAKQMEKITNYILQSPDQPRMDKQQEYNFYNQEEFDKLVKSDSKNARLNVEAVGLRDGNCEKPRQRYNKKTVDKFKYIDKPTKMAYLRRMNENSKLDGKQKIYKTDFKDEDIKDFLLKCEKEKKDIHRVIANMAGKHDTLEYGRRLRIYREMLSDLNDIQRIYKTYKKGMIVFKSPLRDSTKPDYDEFDFTDNEQILALLFMPKKPVMDSDLGCVTLDFEDILKRIKYDKRYPKFTEKEAIVVDCIRQDSNINQEEMAAIISDVYEMECTQQEVSRVYDQIIKKITDGYWQELKDFLVEFRWYGVKKCSRCGEWKLFEDFKKDAYKLDGFRYNCKQCD